MDITGDRCDSWVRECAGEVKINQKEGANRALHALTDEQVLSEWVASFFCDKIHKDTYP